VASFDGEPQAQIRLMLAESLRGVIAHRLLRRVDHNSRALALEILLGTTAVAALIRERKTFQLPTLMQKGKREGMCSMDDSVLALLRDGVIDPQEATVHLLNRESVEAGSTTGPRPYKEAA